MSNRIKNHQKKATYQIRSKLAHKLALQWDRLILKQGVLHRLYIFNEMEYHQLVLPQRYHRKVLTALHDHMGHQGIDRMLDLLRERVYLAFYGQGRSKLGY